MTQLRSDGQACGGIALAIAGTAGHRRRLAGQFLVAVVGVLVAQAMLFYAVAVPAVFLMAMGKGGFMLANGTERVHGFDLPKTMLEGYRNTIEAGLHGNCTWILGYPGEGLRELQHSAAFILWQHGLVSNPAAVRQIDLELNVDTAKAALLGIAPGSIDQTLTLVEIFGSSMSPEISVPVCAHQSDACSGACP